MATATFGHTGICIDVNHLDSHVHVDARGSDMVGEVAEAVSAHYELLQGYVLAPAGRLDEVLPGEMTISELIKALGNPLSLELIAQAA